MLVIVHRGLKWGIFNFQRKSVFRICWACHGNWDQGLRIAKGKETTPIGGTKGAAARRAHFAIPHSFLFAIIISVKATLISWTLLIYCRFIMYVTLCQGNNRDKDSVLAY